MVVCWQYFMNLLSDLFGQNFFTNTSSRLLCLLHKFDFTKNAPSNFFRTINQTFGIVFNSKVHRTFLYFLFYMWHVRRTYLCIFMCAVNFDIFWNPLLHTVHLYGSHDSSKAACQLGRSPLLVEVSSAGVLGSTVP